MDSRTNSVAGAIRQVTEKFVSADLFFGHGTDNAGDEAAWLVFAVAGLSFDSHADVYERPVSVAEREQIDRLCEARINTRKPLAYLLNEAWFMGLGFFVDERVLVPRSPIAELIAERFQPWITAPQKITRAMDLGTGSGCIAIALASVFENATVDAIDISHDALDVARINVERHAMQERVSLIASDLFSSLTSQRYDLIVANPPYVDADDMRDRPTEYRHEPELGLASGSDGLDATRIILKQASRFLNEHGILVCEVGNSAAALEDAFPHLPFIWLTFDAGGDGVFLLTKHDLESE